MMSNTERIIGEWFNQINDMNDENASLRHQLKELEKTHADLDEKYGYLEIANDKLERDMSWMTMVHASFKESTLKEIQGLEAIIEGLTDDDAWTKAEHKTYITGLEHARYNILKVLDEQIKEEQRVYDES